MYRHGEEEEDDDDDDDDDDDVDDDDDDDDDDKELENTELTNKQIVIRFAVYFTLI